MTVSAYCLVDAAGDVCADRDADRPFYAASTIKLAVMLAVARAVDAHALRWDATLPSRRVFRSAVSRAGDFTMSPDDRDERLPPAGTPMSVRGVVRAMIDRSSNEATDMLVDLVGLPAVADALRDAHAADCVMQRRIGDVAAAESGLTNTVTARGLAYLMHAIVTGALATPAATAEMVDALRRQELACIGDVLSNGTVWGSKSGWVDGIEHDVAFVGDSTAAAGVVLAVCTAGYPGRTGGAEIRRIARALLSGRV